MRSIMYATTLITLLASPANAWVDYGDDKLPMPQQAVPASPEHPREVHDSWKMTCFPTNGAPFDVISRVSDRSLIISGNRGVQRVNHILSSYDDGHGFSIEAVGADHRGSTRHIRAHFDSSSGYLLVTDRDAPAISCGPDRANSED